MDRTLIILSNLKYHKWILVNESKEEILQRLENVQLGNEKVIIANQHCAKTYTEFNNLAEWDSESVITINPEHWALINIYVILKKTLKVRL